MTKITLDIPDDQAMALAQVCKRFCYEDAERFANRHDGGRERDAILDGTSTLHVPLPKRASPRAKNPKAGLINGQELERLARGLLLCAKLAAKQRRSQEH